MWILFKLLFILSVFTYIPTLEDAWWRPKEGVFIIIGLIFIASCWQSKKGARYIFDNKWISYFFIYTVLQFGWYFVRLLVFDERRLVVLQDIGSISFPIAYTTMWWNFLPTLNVIIAILIIHHLIEYTDSIERWIGVVKVICVVGVVYSLYAILQNLGCDQFFPKVAYKELDPTKPEVYQMFSFMGNKMLTSNFIAVITPLYLIFKEKKYYVGFGICLLSLFLIRSAYNLGTVLAGILVVLFLQKKWKICLVLILLFLIVMGVFYDKFNFEHMKGWSWNGRINMWGQAIKGSKDKIWTGHGLGSLPVKFAAIDSDTKRWHSAHNIEIDILYELGLIGLFLIGGYLWNLTKRTWHLFQDGRESMLLIGFCGSFVAYLIMAQGSFPHRIAPLAILGIIYISGIEIHLSERRRL